ncbi:MAG: hypothetical protein PHC50_01225 [Candidatus Cloacimonetes bacterium]|nr:hypothetical protein [Candidatus Cloacimonadota bacterium]
MKRKLLFSASIALLLSLNCFFLGCKKDEAFQSSDYEADKEWIAESMLSIFGNYHPTIRISTLEPESTSDEELLKWKLRFPLQTLFEDWEKFTEEKQKEYLQLNDKIPVRFMKHYRFPNDKALIFFEAGGWNMDYSDWGGEGFLYSHPLGVAALEYTEGKWQSTGFNLNIGFYGSYCTTKFMDEIFEIGKDEYGVFTEDYDIALFGIKDKKPVEIVRLPHYRSSGHGDPESYKSALDFISTNKKYHDITLKSKGEDIDNGKKLHFQRRWSWNPEKESYELILFKGNIREILENPEHWMLDYPYF